LLESSLSGKTDDSEVRYPLCSRKRSLTSRGLEPELFKVVDSIFASGYLTAGRPGNR